VRASNPTIGKNPSSIDLVKIAVAVAAIQVYIEESAPETFGSPKTLPNHWKISALSLSQGINNGRYQSWKPMAWKPAKTSYFGLKQPWKYAAQIW
jgi:hypothetical protein